MGKAKKSHKKLWITCIAVATCAVILFVCCAVYVGTYYKAEESSISAFAAQTETEVQMQELQDGDIAFIPQTAKAGLVFYPGGKVEHTAYKPLMQALASRGILCILIQMPFRLAVLDIHAADGVKDTFAGVEKWYIGGHSLGGSMAASYLEKNTQAFDGLVLLGSYSTIDFSNGTKGVLSVYGSEDKVLNAEKYAENKSNLPEDFTEVVIEGGCHAYFGMYGAQKGDGTPTITNEEQIWQTADAVSAFVDSRA